MQIRAVTHKRLLVRFDDIPPGSVSLAPLHLCQTQINHLASHKIPIRIPTPTLPISRIANISGTLEIQPSQPEKERVGVPRWVLADVERYGVVDGEVVGTVDAAVSEIELGWVGVCCGELCVIADELGACIAEWGEVDGDDLGVGDSGEEWYDEREECEGEV